MGSHNKPVQSQPRRISKMTLSLIAFFFGAGVLSVSVVVGAAAPHAASWAVEHSETVIQAAFVALIFPAIWLLGRPLVWFLERRA